MIAFLILTPIVALLYSGGAYFFLEARHDAAVIRNDKLAETLAGDIVLGSARGETIRSIRANSATWHIMDAYLTACTYAVLLGLTAWLHVLLVGSGTVAFMAIVLLLHAATRWLAHDIGVYHWWLGHWKDITPTADGPWDLSNRLDQWWKRHGINHWYVKMAFLALSYVAYGWLYLPW